MLDGNRRNFKTFLSLAEKWDLSKTGQSCQFVHVLKENTEHAYSVVGSPTTYFLQIMCHRKEPECIDNNFLLISQVLISDIFIV